MLCLYQVAIFLQYHKLHLKKWKVFFLSNINFSRLKNERIVSFSMIVQKFCYILHHIILLSPFYLFSVFLVLYLGTFEVLGQFQAWNESSYLTIISAIFQCLQHTRRRCKNWNESIKEWFVDMTYIRDVIEKS